VTTSDGRPAIVPLRWDSHGVDICAVLDNTGVSFVARDILEALGHSVDNLHGSPAHPWAPEAAAATLRDHAAGARWNRQQIHDVVGHSRDPLTAEFLTWLAAQINEINIIGVDTLTRITLDGSTPRSPKPVPAADAVEEAPAEHYSVLAAAKILDRDPAISIGRDSLFELLHRWGWTEKHADMWKPSRDMVLIGYLVVVDNRVPGRQDLYPQICITPLGIQALHQRLGGVAELNLTRQHLTLIGDPR